MDDQLVILLADAAERRAEAAKEPRIDNASLYAESPMYYYCRLCDKLAAVLPECHTEPVPRYCAACAPIFTRHGMKMEYAQRVLTQVKARTVGPRDVRPEETTPAQDVPEPDPRTLDEALETATELHELLGRTR